MPRIHVDRRKERVMATRESSGPATGTGTQTHEQESGLARAGHEVQEKAQEFRGETSDRLREQMDQRSTQAGEQARAVGQALRRSSQQLRTEGKEAPARVVEEVARRADDLGGYLESASVDRMLQDVEAFARRRPWLTGAAAAAAGFLASRLVRASSNRRYEAAGFDGRALESRARGLPAGGV
jgi:ElaB/YqjD/DUF883 family membrane-anchored ribosome-binding protein